MTLWYRMHRWFTSRRIQKRLRLYCQLERLEDRTVPSTFEPIDGVGNNLVNPDWGSTNTELLRVSGSDYADGVSSPSGESRPSGREISNVIVAQDGDTVDERLMSAMIHAWGQFIDHDLDLTKSGDTEAFNIAVPTGDPYFDPTGTGTQVINFFRSLFAEGTGTDASNPREQSNAITAFIDGSMIYGSDQTTADSLRTFAGGRLKTSDGDLLPVDSGGGFLAGDIRVNENPELTSLHTLFMREHNRIADSISASHPGLDDESIYQMARAQVIAEIQVITFREFLPALLGPGAISAYTGYDSSVNPGIATEFSTAGFRIGHTLLGDGIGFLDNNGNEIADAISLKDSFFNPDVIKENGIDPILKYLASDSSSKVDNQLVDSVRNFLFGPPGAGGFDLASLNIQRGRDHGLPDYNTVRAAYGLPRVTSFAQISSDPSVQAKLQELYGSVDNIDLWVGGLAEDHVPGGSVGETFRAIIVDQFERLRDGDRFWYQNIYHGRELDQLEHTTLADVISRNTGTTNLQDNVFFFRVSISGTVFQDLNGNGRQDRAEQGIGGRTVQLLDGETGEVVLSTTTDPRGYYQFDVQSGLGLGSYTVHEVMPGDMKSTTKDKSVDLTRGETFVTANLGEAKSDQHRMVAVGCDTGHEPRVDIYDGDKMMMSFMPFDAGFRGGVRVAMGDVTGDGVDDLLVVAGPGAGAHVKLYDGATYQLVRSFFAFEIGFDNGLQAALGDVNGDGLDDIIIAADTGNYPHVKVFDGATNAEIGSFFAYDMGFRGGVRLASADVDGDGFDDIVTGAGPGAGPHVEVFSGRERSRIRSFFAFDPRFDSGITVGSADTDGDGRADIIIGAGAEAGPHVKVFSSGGAEVASMFVFDESFLGGVRVSATDADGDGRADILAGAGPGGQGRVRILGVNASQLDDFYAFGVGNNAGVSVGGGM